MNPVYRLLKEQPRSDQQWIGLEVERIALQNGKPVRYEPDVRGCLSELHQKSRWAIDYEVDGKILALKKNLHSISVEPGGQFEVSPAPRKSIQEIEKLLNEIDRDVLSTEAASKWKWLYLGLNPWDKPDDIHILPSPRYQLMNQHYRSKPGDRGREMMRLSAGLQINLDFQYDQDGAEMLQAAFWIAPVMSALFSHSPYQFGKRTKALSERRMIWSQTDPQRSGFLAFALEPDFNIEKYSEYVCSAPLMYAYDEDGKVWDPQGKSLRDLPSLLQRHNALAAMRQLFSEVRFKPCCVEVRFLDEQSNEFRAAASAMIIGLLYDKENRQHIRKKYASYSVETLKKLMLEGAERGLKHDEIYSQAKDFFSLADMGLRRRGLNEGSFLAPIDEKLFRHRQTPAELFIAAEAKELGLS